MCQINIKIDMAAASTYTDVYLINT